MIDSSRLWNDIITELSVKYNLDLMVVESAAMKNLSTKEAMKLVLESMGMYSDALLDDILEDIDVMYEKGLRPLTSVIDGIPEILQLLGRESIARVLVSNSTRKQVLMVLRHYGLEDSFDYSVASDDVSKGKPDAEPYLKALQLTGLAPEEALVVEDSDTGVQAAEAASIECIKVNPNSGCETHCILAKRLELQDSGYMKVFINHSPVECKAGTSVASPERIKKVVYEVVGPRALDGLNLRALGPLFDYYLTFAISAEVGVLLRWLEGGCRESVPIMARLMTALMFVRPGDLYDNPIDLDIPSFALAAMCSEEDN